KRTRFFSSWRTNSKRRARGRNAGRRIPFLDSDRRTSSLAFLSLEHRVSVEHRAATLKLGSSAVAPLTCYGEDDSSKRTLTCASRETGGAVSLENAPTLPPSFRREESH